MMCDDSYWEQIEREENARQKAISEQEGEPLINLNLVQKRTREILAEMDER